MGQARRKGTFEDRVLKAKIRERELQARAKEIEAERRAQYYKAYDMMDDTQYELSEERHAARRKRINRVNRTTMMLAAAYASVLPGERW